MEIKEHGKGVLELIDDGIIVSTVNDWSNLFVQADQTTVIVKRYNFHKDFFDLKTLFAGEVLQKFSTYNKRMAIIGDFSDIKSNSFKNFVYESNKTRQIVFLKTIKEALAMFGE
jgi:hypothetical protein